MQKMKILALAGSLSLGVALVYSLSMPSDRSTTPSEESFRNEKAEKSRTLTHSKKPLLKTRKNVSLRPSQIAQFSSQLSVQAEESETYDQAELEERVARIEMPAYQAGYLLFLTELHPEVGGTIQKYLQLVHGKSELDQDEYNALASAYEDELKSKIESTAAAIQDGLMSSDKATHLSFARIGLAALGTRLGLQSKGFSHVAWNELKRISGKDPRLAQVKPADVVLAYKTYSDSLSEDDVEGKKKASQYLSYLQEHNPHLAELLQK